MSVSFVDANGQRQEVNLNGTAFYKEAGRRKQTLRQFINSQYPTKAGEPDAFQQFCASAGLRFKADESLGIPAANLGEMLDPNIPLDAANSIGGTYTSAPAVPDSRILFPAALLEAVESAITKKTESAVGAFDSLIGYNKTIATDRYEQPVIKYTGSKGPEDSQWQRVAQNSRPPIMLGLTASDVTRTIPTTAIGMEISHKALQENALDVVANSLTRFMRLADYNEWITQMGLILSGDPDAVDTPMATCKSALTSFTAQSLDSEVTTAGTITQKAWLKYLYKNSMYTTLTHAVMDWDTMWAIENRTGRQTNVQNNSVDRMDTTFRVIYPTFQGSIDIIVMPTGTWTANTIMGLEKDTALAKIKSSVADYSAIEDMVMKRSMELRYDRGFVIHRQYDSAFSVMTLTV